MPNLVSDKTADWLRRNMDDGNWRTVPRRINHTPAAGGEGDSGCCLATVDDYYYQTGVFTATIWNFRSGSSASGKKVSVICPTMSGVTRLTNGDVVILHKCQMDEYDGEEVEGGES